jgi:thiol-disulfide isomerase/thioredoxin
LGTHVTTSSAARRPRVRAPELRGRGWLNTGGRTPALGDLRGRFVLLDFWSFCCVNCLHVLDELRPLEETYGDELVVVGVHSPKFVHEADPDALAAAVERYQVEHPVLDDPELVTWQAYTARAWPTLVLVDPEGYVVAQYSGEGHAHAIDALVAELREDHLARGTLQPGGSPYVAPSRTPGELRFPAKAIALPGKGFLVADAGHHRLVELEADAETVVRRIGSGERGLVDGASAEARFSEPNGLCLLPRDVAVAVGYDVVVADTVNHALRGVRLADGNVSTIAGTGRQWMQGDPTPLESDPLTPLSSPWDVAWWPAIHEVVVAMAGIHQLWRFDPVTPSLGVWAGTTNEGLLDGPLGQAWFAQTSGVAAGADRLWLADSETSSLRHVEGDQVVTDVGTGLFDFGHVDGAAAEALLQHPLGVTALPDGSVAVSDTYNGALRRFDPATGVVGTLITGLAEPSDAVLLDDGDLLVVESAAHRLTRVRLPQEALVVEGTARRTHRPVTEVAAGEVALEVVFAPPPGQKLDERYGPATRLVVSATPPALLREGEGRGEGLTRRLVLDGHVGDGVLHVAAMAASCDDAAEVEFPACHVHQQDWGVPVRLVEGAPPQLTLYLAG